MNPVMLRVKQVKSAEFSKKSVSKKQEAIIKQQLSNF